MIMLLSIYVVYIVASLWIANRLGLSRKGKIVNIAMTSVGCIVYVSILSEHPIDTNKFIGWAFTRILH
ncbi:hypothetical protein SAMN04487897_1517 [Paenibacillus sp. yr247]|nr:hypothetical protein SAMN04487897_1517 [Paenibacillus sp. yr247]